MTKSRTRSRNRSVPFETAKIYDHNDNQIDGYLTSHKVYDSEIRDVIEKESGKDAQIPGYVDPSELRITTVKQQRTHLEINKRQGSGDPSIVGAISKSFPGLSYNDLRAIVTPEYPTADQLLIDLIRRSAPLQTEVSVPVLAAELIEVASLFRIVTTNFVQLVGSGYLNYNFGIGPFLGDIQRLLKITDKIEGRIAEFNSLLGKGGLSRKINLGSFNTTSRLKKQYVSTSFAVITTADIVTDVECKIWGTIRWFPKDGTEIPIDKLKRFNLAVRSLLDLDDFSWETVWQAIPFTWLVDYFVEIGPQLEAINVLDQFEPKHVCIMRELTGRQRREGFQISAPHLVRVTHAGLYQSSVRSRWVYSPEQIAGLRTMGFSLLDVDEALILTALFSRMFKHKDLISKLNKQVKL